MKIGLLGGTFDPPHLGHLIMAEHVLEAMHLDEVWFVPSHVPPHKQESALVAEDRLRMVERAIEENPQFSVSTVELEREGKSFTIDTMKQLQNQYPSYDFCFIIGGDMVQHLDRWHRIDELQELVQFIGVGREGYQLDSSRGVKLIDIPRIDISSSMIRKRLAKGKSIRYLVTHQVYEYIKEHSLYVSNS
ncbi:putative nicotinate-nucleotide adenylyltransferase [Halobacillus andaensis]|uniref:Probable nicotinate-nucleotide adenylyltransferase n=1 Tax=Halobacillus andaensis TaxID=1176239 RepID=A0A917B035_HALAA|nr:nicotinate-nucleotide adenylyltransferase [Halobacillus andaensis]MBP2003021.1 nicotinate-nucleotide adenylyltransferase [Halobacillus andaensis]GGF07428.1 putative nicotinate-nucleotide adenylyltransferase [Halobacillus andaensis]